MERLLKVGTAHRALPTWLMMAIELGVELAIALGVGLGLVAVGLGGAAWILGGMIGGTVVFSALKRLSDQPLRPNRTARKIGQVIVGLAIGLSLQQNQLDTIAAHLPIFIGLPLCLMVSGAVIGIIYSRLEKTDLLTALLATTPGNIGVMASMAADYSRNTPLVSLVQLLRFTSVIVAMPMLANVAVNVSVPHPVGATLSEFIHQLVDIPWSTLMISSVMLAIAALAGYLGGQVKIPIAAFLAAIAIGLLFNLAPLLFPTLVPMDFHLPFGVNLLGQALLGVTIGEYWGINPPLQPTTIARAIIPVSLMFMAGFATAAIIHQLTAWQWLTCLLIAAPGGSPEMIWIALTLHQDTEIITAGHIIRLLTINLTLPLLVSLANYLEPAPIKTEVEEGGIRD